MCILRVLRGSNESTLSGLTRLKLWEVLKKFFQPRSGCYNSAQGCCASQLPWDRVNKRAATLKGVADLLQRTLAGHNALSRETDATPWGLRFKRPFAQGSRDARQPWAELRNRF